MTFGQFKTRFLGLNLFFPTVFGAKLVCFRAAPFGFTGVTGLNTLWPRTASTRIFDVKRLMGRNFKDPQVQRDMKSLPFEVLWFVFLFASSYVKRGFCMVLWLCNI